MSTLGTRPRLSRFTLSTVFTASAFGAVLVAFACGGNGTTGTPPGTTDDMTWTGESPDMAAPAADMTVPGLSLTNVSPSAVSTAGGTTVTLTGTSFAAGATVKLGTVVVPATDTTVDANGTSITIRVPARLGMPGKVDVTVTNPDTKSTTAPGALTYYFGQVSFGTATAVATDVGPRCVIVTDLNKDNKLDLVTANYTSNTISAFLGSGTGTFNLSVNRGVGSKPYALAVGDVDGDTNLDLVSANQSGTVSVMKGDGTGNLNSPVSNSMYLNATNMPQAVAILDINGDGKQDLAVGLFGATTDNVALLMGNNSTTFNGTGSQTITVNGGSLYALIADDVNKDNKLDLIAVHKSTAAVNVSPLLNKAAAPFFDIAANKSAGASPTAVATGDFNNDGFKDLAVVNQGANNVSFLKGSATGAFTDTAANGTTAVGTGPEHLAALDVNQDGNLDLVVANLTSGNVSLLLGKGDGTFMTATTINVGANVQPNWVAVGDFNKDGKLDLVVTDYNPAAAGRVMVVLNTSQ